VEKVNEETTFNNPFVGKSVVAQDVGVATNQNLLSITFVDKERGYAVGHEGIFLYTRDGGLRWIYSNAPTSKTLVRVVAIPNTDTVLILDNKGNVYQSFDYGQTWFVVITGIEVLDILAWEPQQIYFFDVQAKDIMYSQDGGMTYKIEPMPQFITDCPSLDAATWSGGGEHNDK
jgi:hypothetical protein